MMTVFEFEKRGEIYSGPVCRFTDPKEVYVLTSERRQSILVQGLTEVI